MKILSILLAITLISVPTSAMAMSSTEAQDAIESTQDELSENQESQDKLLENQYDLQDEITDVNSQMDELNDEIDQLNDRNFKTKFTDFNLQIIHSIKHLFNHDATYKHQTTKEKVEDIEIDIEHLQENLDDLSLQLNNNTDEIDELKLAASDITMQLTDLQTEYDEAIEREEAARKEQEEAERAAEEAAIIANAQDYKDETDDSYQESYYEETYEEPDYSYSDSSSESYDTPSGSGVLTKSKGLNNYDGHTETWYTMQEWTGDLGIPGMTIGSDGVVRDGDGYVCVSSDDYSRGTVVDTSLGVGKVYDSGSGSGNIDIYTDWSPY